MPEEIDGREDTGVIMQDDRLAAGTKIAVLLERYNNLKANVATKEDMRREVTGARKSIEADAVVQFADAKLFEELVKTVESIKPPGFWKIGAGVAGFFLTVVLTVGGIVYSASGRVSDLALANAIQKMQIDGLDAAVKRLDAQLQQVQSKLDQLLIRGAKP